ncbi:Prefoldin subunit 6 [Candida viswanathii]|uniref:Prefoldin subunit 6 n=1 Tax=Candida viswanathii TaxID=5486 RepID=A0A367YJK6_9ASCO|nr:Prefoldin subunit 6 [Candida viswanathii]
MSDLKQQFETLSMNFNTHQTQLNDLISSRSKLETQYQENKIVKQEFESLDEDSKIYKLTGPILLPQDFSEAKMNVNKRIEFIEGEIKRVETKIESEEKELEDTRSKLIAVRSQLQ